MDVSVVDAESLDVSVVDAELLGVLVTVELVLLLSSFNLGTLPDAEGLALSSIAFCLFSFHLVLYFLTFSLSLSSVVILKGLTSLQVIEKSFSRS